MLVSYQIIGRNIRDARKRAGFTQAGAAVRLGMSQPHFGRIERGDRPVSLELIAQMAVAFDASVDDMLVGAIENQTVSLSPNANAAELGRSVAECAAGCSERGLNLMFDMCKLISDYDRVANK